MGSVRRIAPGRLELNMPLPIPENLSARGGAGWLARQLKLSLTPMTPRQRWKTIENLGLPPTANGDIDIADHSAVGGARQVPLFAAVSRKVKPPRHATSVHRIFESMPHGEASLNSPGLDLLIVENGYFCNFAEVPIVIASDGRTVIRDYSSEFATMVHFHAQSMNECIAKTRYLDGRAVLLWSDAPPANYCHWILDWLPQLAFLGAQCRSPDTVVITPPLTTQFQRTSLNLCGFTSDRIIEVGNFTALQVRELLVPGRIATPAHRAAPWAMAHLRSMLGFTSLSAHRTSDRLPDKIFVSRSDARRRVLINEDDLGGRLRDLGYTVINLSNLGLDDQIALFSSASRVVSLHGAGLTNFVFSRHGARLLEILPRSYGMRCFYTIAAGLENGYMNYVEENIVRGANTRSDDVIVDVDSFLDKCSSFIM
jgi:capsular polysaccharide biosynthesis protein